MVSRPGFYVAKGDISKCVIPNLNSMKGSKHESQVQELKDTLSSINKINNTLLKEEVGDTSVKTNKISLKACTTVIPNSLIPVEETTRVVDNNIAPISYHNPKLSSSMHKGNIADLRPKSAKLNKTKSSNLVQKLSPVIENKMETTSVKSESTTTDNTSTQNKKPNAKVCKINLTKLGTFPSIPWDQPSPLQVKKPLLLTMDIMPMGQSILCNADGGSDVNLIDPKLIKSFNLQSLRMKEDIILHYADNAMLEAFKECTMQLKCQGQEFRERFIISPTPLPGVDIILGRSFFVSRKVGQGWRGEKEVLTFPDGKIWWFNDTLGTQSVSICHVGAQQAFDFMKDANGRTEVCAISVKQFLDEKGLGYKPTGKKKPPDEGTSENILLSTAKKKPPNEGNDTLSNPSPEIKVEKHAIKCIQDALDQYLEIFSERVPEDAVDLRNSIQDPLAIHKIPLKDGALPVKRRAIPMSAGEQAIVMELLKDLLEKNYIEETNNSSLWSAPIILLRKPGNRVGLTNQWRIVTDYRALNELTKGSTYAPPAIREMIDNLKGKKIFSKSDNVGGFYQMTLAPEDREKTTFSVQTPQGIKSYFFKVACLGLQGCPASYQAWMENVIAGCDGTSVYLDDVMYAADTFEEMAALMCKTFQRFKERGVYLHPQKCQWAVTQIDFLGMSVSHNVVKISAEKVQALTDYPEPDSYPAVRRFVGFAQYLSQFIPRFSTIMAPITDTLKDQEKSKAKKKFRWNQACREAFYYVKQQLSTSRGLLIPDKEGQFVLETDASGEGIGVCLYQWVNDQLIPAWYSSRKLNQAERNYNTRDREALAVVYGMDKCKGYLSLRKFIIFSDHQSLSFFKQQPILKGRDWRWQETLSKFEFEHRYRKGETMFVSDALSRAFATRNKFNTGEDWSPVEHGTGSIIEVDPKKSPFHPLETVNVSFIGIQEGLSNETLDSNWIDLEIDRKVIAMPCDDLQGIKLKVIKNNLQYRKMKKYANPAHANVAAARVYSDVPSIIKKYIEKDPDYMEIYRAASESAADLSEKQVSMLRHYRVIDELLYFCPDGNLNNMKLVIPVSPGNELRKLMLYEAHDGATVHVGVNKTYEQLSDRCFWNSMNSDVNQYVNTCSSCSLKKTDHHRPTGLMQGLTIPQDRWEIIQMDWITGLPKTEEGFDQILVCVDRLTKYAYFIEAANTDTAEDVANRLWKRVISIHGLPSCIISDRDTKFCAEFFKSLMQFMRVKQRMGTSYYHAFNGAVEVLNRTVEVMLRHLIGDDVTLDFTELLPNVQWAYNTTYHKSIQMTPYEALYGFKPKTPVSFPSANVNEFDGMTRSAAEFTEHQRMQVRRARYALLQAQRTMEVFQNRTFIDVQFQENEMVYLWAGNLGNSHFPTNTRKLRDRYKGPYKILKQISNYTYLLDLPKDEYPRAHPEFHASLLWRAPSREEFEASFCNPKMLPTYENYVPEADTIAIDQPSQVEDVIANTDEISVNIEEIANETKPQKVIESILDKKRNKFLVKWKDLPDIENSWINWKEDYIYQEQMAEYDAKLKAEERNKEVIPARTSERQQARHLKYYNSQET